jgi:hypothetical protein
MVEDGKAGSQIDGCGGLPYSAFLVCYSYDFSHGLLSDFTVGKSTFFGRFCCFREMKVINNENYC